MAVFQAPPPKGLIKDVNNTIIPFEFYSEASNVRFADSAAKKIQGHDQVFGTPTVAPYFVLNWSYDVNSFWFYAGTAKIYRLSGTSTHTDFTRASGGDYSTNLTTVGNWTGTIYNGLPILCNGIDDPQALATTGASAFSDLPNWPSNTTCKTIKAFGNYLMALNLTESGTNLPNKVRWGDTAEDFNFPSTWTAAATNDAGAVTIGDEADEIIDGLALKESFIIYKGNSTWIANYIGGNLVFSFKKLFNDTGILTRNCVQEFEGKHFVLTQGDIIVHNGVSKQSVATNAVKKHLFDDINSSYYQLTFVTHNVQKSEMWISYPSLGSEFCNKALIYNYVNNSFTFRDLPDIYHIGPGIVDPGATTNTWNTQSGTWTTTAGTYGDRLFNPTERSILFAGTSDTKLYRGDFGQQFDNENFITTVERKGLTLDGNNNTVKQVRKLTPRVKGTGTVNISVGSSLSPNGTYTFNAAQSFDPNSQNKVDCRVSGKFIAVRFQHTSNSEFELNGYDLEYEVLGER